MSRLPIRVRIALVFAGAMALVLGGAGWFVHDRVGSDLSRSLDQQLRSRAQDLSALVRRGGSLHAGGAPLVERGESFAELLSASGVVLDSTPPIGGRLLLSPEEFLQARREPVFADRPSAPGLDEPARILAVPLVRAGSRLVLAVGVTRENRAEVLRSLRNAFLLGGPLALLLTALGGYAVAGAALRPIESMRRRAAAISSSSISERLPVPEARDEVARLGETLNAMLGRIEEGVDRERRFVADASHELRTPLSLLKTELELALRRARSPEQLQEALSAAAASTDRLVRLADDLLLLARAEHGGVPLKWERVDVTDLLHAVAKRFEGRAEGAGRIVAVKGGPVLVISADPLRLEQALSNLVDNALRHGEGRATLRAHRADRTVELHVEDEGPGFPPDFAAHAFERFSRADLRDEGSGLGLAIVDTIAAAHRGTAHAATTGARGTDVWISLPL